jgi:hypothetical protein
MRGISARNGNEAIDEMRFKLNFKQLERKIKMWSIKKCVYQPCLFKIKKKSVLKNSNNTLKI